MMGQPRTSRPDVALERRGVLSELLVFPTTGPMMW